MDRLADIFVAGTSLDFLGFIVLCGTSFFGSLIATVLGLGGGTLMLATMALLVPPPVLIPLHGVVQLGSNLCRTVLLVRNVLKSAILVFVAGTILGAGVGGNLVITLPTPLLQAILAFFILHVTWVPIFQARRPGKQALFCVGVFGAFATMFIGATAPLIAPFVSAACNGRQQVVATIAMFMVIQHALKIITFGLLGFAYGPYVPLLVGLLAFGFAGTFAGRLVLDRIPERAFRISFKTIITFLSLHLFYNAASVLFD